MKVGMYGGKFLPFHMGHAYALTKAACMVDELYVVLSYSKSRDANLCKGNIKEIPFQVRLKWLHQFTKDMENVHIIGVEDRFENDKDYDWTEGANLIKKKVGKPIDFIFSSEEAYEDIFTELYPEAHHVLLDKDRSTYPISATRIREEGVFKHWEYLPDVVKPHFVKKVMVVGTESCGKSTLTRYLAKIYNTTFAEEYGRLMCDEMGGCEGIITREDFHTIVYAQKLLEKQALEKANKLVFFDTESIVTQYYSQLYIGSEQAFFDEVAKDQEYDLWIYLEPDVQWVDDGLRMHGQKLEREANNRVLKRMLEERNVSYSIIEGSYLERLNKAVQLVEELIEV